MSDSPSRAANPRQGDVIADRFEIVGEAGSGGMGTVYQARDRSSGRTVAVKLLEDVTQHLERFELEGTILERFEHPAIVGYVAHGKTVDGQPYLAMEWLEGETLRDYLSREGCLGPKQALALGRQIADALATAHGKGIIHRDLKPSNLFLVGGDLARLKILDFGVARWRDVDRELTLTNQIIGTPGYMAPEQARGLRQIDARADLFALGCVLFRSIAGQPAFSGDDVLVVLAQLVAHEPPLLGDVADGVPVELEELVRRLLAKQPERRPESAEVVRNELDRIAKLLESGSSRIRERVPKDLAAPTHAFLLASSNDPAQPLTLSDEELERLENDLTEVQGRITTLVNGALLVDVEPGSDPASTGERARRAVAILSKVIPSDRMRVETGMELASTIAVAERPVLEAPARSARLAWGLGGVALVVGAVLLFSARSRPAPAPSAPSQPVPTSPALPLASSTSPQAPLVEAVVSVQPADAMVSVNGKEQTLNDGGLSLRGRPGEAFDVSARLGSRTASERIIIGVDGQPSVAVLKIGGPTAARHPAAPSGAASAPAPAPASAEPPKSPGMGPSRENW